MKTKTKTKIDLFKQRQQRHVSDDVLGDMLSELIKLHESGLSYSDMVPKMKKFWTGSKLESGHQLRSYAANVYHRSDCPAFFKKWVDEGRPRNGTPTSKVRKSAGNPRRAMLKALSTNQIVQLADIIMDCRQHGFDTAQTRSIIEDNLPLKLDRPSDVSKITYTLYHSSSAPEKFKEWFGSLEMKRGPRKGWKSLRMKDVFEVPEKKPTDDAELAAMYSRENESLKKRVAELESAGASRDAASVKEAIAALVKLVKLGMMSMAEAWAMVARYSEQM